MELTSENMSREHLTQCYRQRSQTLTEQIDRLRSRNRAFVASELVTFIAMLACVGVYAFTSAGAVWLWVAAVLLVAYVIIRHVDGRNSDHVRRMTRLRAVNDHELQYMQGDFTPFATGEQYQDAHHDYALDMDLFGAGSLFNRVCRTVTTGGSDQLAAWMKDNSTVQPDDVAARRAAIAELAAAGQLREQFMALGSDRLVDTADVQTAMDAARDAKIPHWMSSPLAVVTAVASMVVLAVLVALAAMGRVPATMPVLWACLQGCVAIGLCHGSLNTAHGALKRASTAITSLMRIVELIAHADLKSEENAAIVATLGGADGNALASFKELSRLVDSLERRANVLGLLLCNSLMLSDLWLARRYARWQSGSVSHVSQWLQAVSRIDALVSLATFRHNEPSARDPQVVQADAVVLDARGVWHPFLGDKAVRNDFTLQDGHFYIITGANMAGKSTFLRTLGLNYVLARMGMPVFAQQMTVSLFTLFSSMRTSDDLTHGISYFNAELLRLQQLLECCSGSSRTLIILDEILKGTNSLDKLNGSRMFLQHVATLPVTGVIATHDLELSRMADDASGRFHNYCFEIQLADEITYTYKIAPGVARNQNATHLLRSMLAASLHETR